MSARRYIRVFNEIGLDDVPSVGGKNASLGEMYRNLNAQGVKVPNGFAITADAYRYLLGQSDAWPALHEALDGLNPDDMGRDQKHAAQLVCGTGEGDAARALLRAHVELFVGSDTPGARTSIVLERLAEQVAAHGVSVSTVTRMQRPVHEAILKRAESICADLIVTDCYAGSHIAPALFQLTDWELARLSPIPVLIVKQQRMYRHPKVLAAVDPTPCAW